MKHFAFFPRHLAYAGLSHDLATRLLRRDPAAVVRDLYMAVRQDREKP